MLKVFRLDNLAPIIPNYIGVALFGKKLSNTEIIDVPG